MYDKYNEKIPHCKIRKKCIFGLDPGLDPDTKTMTNSPNFSV